MATGSEAVAGIAGLKLLGGVAGVAAGGAGLASVVVMCMTMPRSKSEWVVGLVSTVIGSLSGGAGLISYFNLHALMDSYVGLVAVLGLVFACGLPAWAIVRWTFNYINQHHDSSLNDVVNDMKGWR